MFDLDNIVHIVELAGAIPILWKANRCLNRFLDNLEDYPLHRHVELNGAELIQYPKGVLEKR